MSHDVPQDRWVSANGVRLRLRDWGGTGRTILLLHGLASTSRIWDLTAPLLRRYAHVVAFDQRGHGESEQPADGYDFETLVADLRAVLGLLGAERPVVIGHSWGGNVALHYAAAYPDEPAGVVFIDGGFLELAAIMDWPETERELAPPALAGMPLEEFRRRLREEWMRERWSEVWETSILANFRVEDGRIYPRLPRSLHMRILRALWDQRPSELYERVRCPALLLPAEMEDGDADRRFYEGKCAAIARALAGMARARVHWFSDTIHDVPVQRPQELAAIVGAWLEELA
ncbi:MAG: hydrolase [Herpetosiphonaceae bacterium]|nr:MAG: hydrolase [Herpetosiphonaceae bacterium]